MKKITTLTKSERTPFQSFASTSLIDIYRSLSSPLPSVALSGTQLTIQQVIAVSRDLIKVSIASEHEIQDRISKSHSAMIEDIRRGRCVYGCNTSFGARVTQLLNDGNSSQRLSNARKLSEGLVFCDVGTGPIIAREIVRAAIVIRTNMLLHGVSGVRLSTLEILLQLINNNLTPVVQEYGGVGASGDLCHNQRVVNVIRGLPHLKIIDNKGKIINSTHALKKNNIKLLKLAPKEGLALVNGDNFSSAFAIDVVFRFLQCFLICVSMGAITIEVLQGTDRSFHPILSDLRPHPGQKEMAQIYRNLLFGSQLAYQEMKGNKPRPKGIKIQDGYSLRCLAQFEGVIAEKIKWALDTISININSVSDNPLWVPEDYATHEEEPWQAVNGGNFLASYMAEVLDSLRQVTTKLIKRNDRHLSRLVNPFESNGLPPNLSYNQDSISSCTFKGVQIQSGMLEVYSMALSNPISVLFGIHEEGNQDITSHAITSGIMALKNLELLRYSIAGNLLAVAQATDLRGGPDLLSSKTRPIYEFVRTISKKITKDRPLAKDIEKVANKLEDGSMMKVLMEQVFV